MQQPPIFGFDYNNHKRRLMLAFDPSQDFTVEIVMLSQCLIDYSTWDDSLFYSAGTGWEGFGWDNNNLPVDLEQYVVGRSKTDVEARITLTIPANTWDCGENGWVGGSFRVKCVTGSAGHIFVGFLATAPLAANTTRTAVLPSAVQCYTGNCITVPSTGVCCSSNACVDGITDAECTSRGGQFFIPHTTCQNNPVICGGNFPPLPSFSSCSESCSPIACINTTSSSSCDLIWPYNIEGHNWKSCNLYNGAIQTGPNNQFSGYKFRSVQWHSGTIWSAPSKSWNPFTSAWTQIFNPCMILNSFPAYGKAMFDTNHLINDKPAAKYIFKPNPPVYNTTHSLYPKSALHHYPNVYFDTVEVVLDGAKIPPQQLDLKGWSPAILNTSGLQHMPPLNHNKFPGGNMFSYRNGYSHWGFGGSHFIDVAVHPEKGFALQGMVNTYRWGVPPLPPPIGLNAAPIKKTTCYSMNSNGTAGASSCYHYDPMDIYGGKATFDMGMVSSSSLCFPIPRQVPKIQIGYGTRATYELLNINRPIHLARYTKLWAVEHNPNHWSVVGYFNTDRGIAKDHGNIISNPSKNCKLYQRTDYLTAGFNAAELCCGMIIELSLRAWDYLPEPYLYKSIYRGTKPDPHCCTTRQGDLYAVVRVGGEEAWVDNPNFSITTGPGAQCSLSAGGCGAVTNPPPVPPTYFGACCLRSGTCMDNMSQFECEYIMKGTWGGPLSNCAPSDCCTKPSVCLDDCLLGEGFANSDLNGYYKSLGHLGAQKVYQNPDTHAIVYFNYTTGLWEANVQTLSIVSSSVVALSSTNSAIASKPDNTYACEAYCPLGDWGSGKFLACPNQNACVPTGAPNVCENMPTHLPHEINTDNPDGKCGALYKARTPGTKTIRVRVPRLFSEHEAKGLLTYAFANNVLENVKIQALKTKVKKIIANKIGVKLGFEL